MIVIPSASEGSRHETFKATQRDPSTALGMTGLAWQLMQASSVARCKSGPAIAGPQSKTQSRL